MTGQIPAMTHVTIHIGELGAREKAAKPGVQNFNLSNSHVNFLLENRSILN